jgi:hypothetical protein
VDDLIDYLEFKLDFHTRASVVCRRIDWVGRAEWSVGDGEVYARCYCVLAYAEIG